MRHVGFLERRPLVALCLALFVLLSGTQAAPAQQAAGDAMSVGVDAVREEPLQQTTAVLGRLVAREGGVVAARTAGPVQEVRVHVGDRVEEGDILAVLVKDTLLAQVEQSSAEVRQAEQELERLENLRARGSAAFQRARYDDAAQRLAQAQANLRIVEIALRDSEIRAPYPGVVTERHTESGAYVAQGAPVVTLVNYRALEVEADVPADLIDGLSPGIEVRFTIPGRGARDFVSMVRAIVPQENPNTRTVAVRFTPSLGDTGFTPRVGQAVELAVPIGERRTVVTVHKDAVLARGPGQIVFLVVDGQAQPRPVQLGAAVGSRFVVENGLSAGDIVIIRGNERVQPGQSVRTDRDS